MKKLSFYFLFLLAAGGSAITLGTRFSEAKTCDVYNRGQIVHSRDCKITREGFLPGGEIKSITVTRERFDRGYGLAVQPTFTPGNGFFNNEGCLTNDFGMSYCPTGVRPGSIARVRVDNFLIRVNCENREIFHRQENRWMDLREVEEWGIPRQGTARTQIAVAGMAASMDAVCN